MERFEIRGTAARRVPGDRRQAITGVNASGNLEVLVERVLPATPMSAVGGTAAWSRACASAA